MSYEYTNWYVCVGFWYTFDSANIAQKPQFLRNRLRRDVSRKTEMSTVLTLVCAHGGKINKVKNSCGHIATFNSIILMH